MIGKQHILAGLCTGAGLGLGLGVTVPNMGVVNTVYSFFLLGGAFIGSQIPDLDADDSSISHRHPLISKIFAKHRGILHDIGTIPLLFGLFIWLNIPLPIGINFFIIGLMTGWLSHILLDSITKMGVPFFFSNKWSKPWMFHLLPEAMCCRVYQKRKEDERFAKVSFSSWVYTIIFTSGLMHLAYLLPDIIRNFTL